MALKSTIFRVNLQVNDFDRHYYQAHALTLARHPSETDERMMVRVLAFALHAGDSLAFGNGLSTNTIAQCPAGQCAVLIGGNPDLTPEKARTYALG